MKRLYKYALKKREGLVLEWDEGFGEIAPLPHFSGEQLSEAEAEIVSWIRENKEPTLPSVRFGIASAQRPLESVKLPLCSLGPKAGFQTTKLKMKGLSLKEAVALVKEHLGKTLRVDCNRAWSLDEALEFASHFQASDFEYLEEPVKSVEELIAFSKKTGFPIALDESIHTDWTQIPSLKAIVVKPTLVGFIPKVPPHLKLILSSSYESGLGLIHIANLAKNQLPIGLDTVFEDDILVNPIRSTDGFFEWKKSESILDFGKLCPVL